MLLLFFPFLPPIPSADRICDINAQMFANGLGASFAEGSLSTSLNEGTLSTQFAAGSLGTQIMASLLDVAVRCNP